MKQFLKAEQMDLIFCGIVLYFESILGKNAKKTPVRRETRGKNRGDCNKKAESVKTTSAVNLAAAVGAKG
jgi:hypothetical protein